MHLCIGHGDQVNVRVGGGYMKVEEFMAQYSEIESSRFSKNDTIIRMRNKIQLQSIASKLASEKRELSPI